MGINDQIKKLLSEGLTQEEVAQALNMRLDDVALATTSMSKHTITAEELFSKHKARAVEVLAHIMLNGENESARVKAAQIILDGKGEMPEIAANKINDMIRKMQGLSTKYQSNIIEIPPSNSVVNTTVTVDTPSSDVLEMAGAI